MSKHSEQFNPPSSGEILGTLIHAFELELPGVAGKTAQRYFNGEYVSGQRISKQRKKEIWLAIGKAVHEANLLPQMSVAGEIELTADRTVTLLIASIADRWDSLIGTIGERTAPVERPDLASAGYLRLSVVDVALRLVAVVRLSEIEIPAEEIPLWAQENAGRLIIRRLLEMSEESLSRELISSSLGVRDNTVDAWFDDGARPSKDNIEKLAKLFESLCDWDRSTIASWLDRQYSFSDLADRLAQVVGRAEVRDCAKALNRFVYRSSEGLDSHSKLTGRDADIAQFVLMTGGIASPGGPSLIGGLYKQEEDPLWRAVLNDSTQSWIDYLIKIQRASGGFEEAAELALREHGIPKTFTEKHIAKIVRSSLSDYSNEQVEGTVVRITGDSRFKARNRSIQAEAARGIGDLEESTKQWRYAISHDPNNAEHHFQLACDLGALGQTDDSIAESYLAAELNPGWNLPLAEIGVVLLNSGRDQEAVTHLERSVDQVVNPSAQYFSVLGIARMRVGEYRRAIDPLIQAIERRPRHIGAIEALSRCYYEVDDKKNGLRYAKKASDLSRGPM